MCPLFLAFGPEHMVEEKRTELREKESEGERSVCLL